MVLIAGKGHEPTQTIGDRDRRSTTARGARAAARHSDDRRHDRRSVRDDRRPVRHTFLITVFIRNRGQGQPILGKEDHGPDHHMHKQGTPDDGRTGHRRRRLLRLDRRPLPPRSGLLRPGAIAWVGIFVLSAMGFLDDCIKVRKAHNRGIFWKKKGYITLVISMGIAWWLVAATASARRCRSLASAAGLAPDVAGLGRFAGVTIWSTSNAVNVTDGLDGLAAASVAGVRGVHDHRLLGVP